MSGEHDHDQNPTLDEIESAAAVVAGFWLHEAEHAIRDKQTLPACEAAAINGFMQAAAINYAAERHVDAAVRIAEGLQAVAAAIREQGK